MRLIFLGTAAAEGYPGVFCNCDNCNEARRLGGKNIRFRSALLVNDNLLIDFGPDLSASAQRFNLNLSRVTTGLVTHAHADHFHLHNFEMREEAFTGGLSIPTLHLYAPRDAAAMVSKEFPNLSQNRMVVHPIQAFETWEHDGYQISSYKAYHAIDFCEAMFYSIENQDGAFLYATDTGPFPPETWQALQGRTFDVIILEETMGDEQFPYPQHQSFATFVEHVQKMRALGMLKPGGRVIAHHMSHSGNPTHEKIEAILGPHGVEVAYDGLEVRI
jgi:phosphoribosyl 1,2-cyclic phosphate phosphodiesterase